jgi:hypothetical protein
VTGVVPDGFAVEIAEIHGHAAQVAALRQRFAAVRTASAGIAQDDAAYGVLCGWMASILERRHVRQDELIAYVEENLALAAEALDRTAQDYAAADDAAASRIRRAGES